MKLSELTPPTDLPAADARVPALAIRAALATVGILLTLVVYGISGWLAVGVIFSLLAAWAPEYLLAWGVIVFLALGELDRPAGLSWHLLVLIAGAHLLHLLGMLALTLPWRSWLQPRLFKRLLLRFIAIQIPVQLLAVVALLLLAPNAHGKRPLTAPAFTIAGAAALAALALLLLGHGDNRGGLEHPSDNWRARMNLDLTGRPTIFWRAEMEAQRARVQDLAGRAVQLEEAAERFKLAGDEKMAASFAEQAAELRRAGA